MPDLATGLERRYERLLVAYPPGYRTERGPEIVATLLDAAAPGRRWPRPAEAVDLVQAGLLERSRIAKVPGLAGGLTAAAPLALALATGISAFLWWRVEPVVPPGRFAQQWPFDGVTTLGPLAYAAWLLAALARAALRPAAGRLAIAAAIVVTVLVIPGLATTSVGVRPPLWVLMALAGFGALALVGTAPALGAPVPSVEERLGGLAGTVAIAVCTSTLTRAWIAPAQPGHSEYYGPTIARVGAVVVAAVVAVAVLAAVHLVRGRPAHDRLWAAALLGLPAGWLGPFDLLTPSLAASAPHFGRLAQVLFATCVAVAVMHLLATVFRSGSNGAGVAGQRPPTLRTPGRPAGLARAGWHALGTAAGLSGWIALAYLGVSGPRPEPGTGAPAYVLATLAVLGALGLTAGIAGRFTDASAVGHGLGQLVTATGVSFLAAWVVAAYVNDWTLRYWENFGHTAAVATGVVLVPLCECAIAAARARRAAARASGRRRTTTALLAGTLAWLAVLTVQYLPGWAPPLLGAAACVAASALARRHSTRDIGPLQPQR
jgi:hypothetical protein